MIAEYNEILQQEEPYWKQKSRVQWLKEGEQNTRFFDNIAILRKRHTIVIKLKNEEDVWIIDTKELKLLA